MQKIIKVSVPAFRTLRVLFSNNTEGTVKIEDNFASVAYPLNDPQRFSSAKIIDDGYGVGFDDCDYDICSNWLYEQLTGKPDSIKDSVPNNDYPTGCGKLRCAEDKSKFESGNKKI